MRRLTIAVLLIGALLAAPASAKQNQQEQRITELVSKPPAGVADTGVCGAQRHGCEIELTPDGRFALFALNDGPLVQWHDGANRVVSDGPLGIGAVGVSCYPYNGPCYFRQTADGRKIVFVTQTKLVPEDTARSTDVYIRTPAGTRLVSTVGPANAEYSYRAYFGFVSPASDRIFYGFDTFGEEDPWLYEWTAANGPHRFPSESNPAEHPIIVKQFSADGQHLLFTTRTALSPEDKNGIDLYERTRDGRIRLISNVDGKDASEVAFVGASPDGGHIFFTTFRRPAYGAPRGTAELYERSGDTTRLIAAGVSAASPAISDDGSKVFFTTDESLVPQDQDGALVYDPLVDDFVFENDPDIYEWSNGRFSLVSTGPLEGDGRLNPILQRVSQDGRYVYFYTTKALVPEDTNNSQDLYVRDTVRGVTRLSSDQQQASDTPAVPGRFLAASDDGRRVFFETDQALVPQDTDRCVSYEGRVSGCNDIYERFRGEYTLVSTGPSDTNGTCDDSLDFGARVCPGFIGISPDGRRVFFQTRLSLTPDDTNAGLNDVYVSRVVKGRKR